MLTEVLVCFSSAVTIEMRKTALLWSMMAAAMVVTFGVIIPTTAAKKHNQDVGITSADENGNDIGRGGDNRAEVAAAAAHEYEDGKKYEDSAAAVTESSPAKTPKHPSFKQHNAKLLNKLGMKRVRTNGGANHHRKRLASQSRSKYAATGSADGKGGSDSQMFIVKLPPHAHFYDDGSATGVHHQNTHHQQHQYQKQTPYKSMNTVPVGFVSNGKPAKVYHWNLPAIKHALTGSRYKGVNDVTAIQPQHNHHQQVLQYNQLVDFELPSAAGSKIVPRRTLYYKPRAAGKPVKKSFVNNGKPNGFYVVSSGKNAAVPQYHKIVKAYYGSGDD